MKSRSAEKIKLTSIDELLGVVNEEEIVEEDGILHHEEHVDLLPANIELSALEVTMSNVMSR